MGHQRLCNSLNTMISTFRILGVFRTHSKVKVPNTEVREKTSFVKLLTSLHRNPMGTIVLGKVACDNS